MKVEPLQEVMERFSPQAANRAYDPRRMQTLGLKESRSRASRSSDDWISGPDQEKSLRLLSSGRKLQMLPTKTVERERPEAVSKESRNRPETPQKGRPCWSSSAPG